MDEVHLATILTAMQTRPLHWWSTRELCEHFGHYSTDGNMRKKILYHLDRGVLAGYLEKRCAPKSRGWFQWWEFRLKERGQ